MPPALLSPAAGHAGTWLERCMFTDVADASAFIAILAVIYLLEEALIALWDIRRSRSRSAPPA